MTQRYTTGFHYTLATAFAMGFEAPPEYRGLGQHDYPIEIGVTEDEETFHAIEHGDEPCTTLWFEDEVWSFALRNGLRNHGIAAVVAWDTGEHGWHHDIPLSVPRSLVIFTGTRTEAESTLHAYMNTVLELELSIDEAWELCHTAMAGHRVDDGFMWWGKGGTHIGHQANSRQAAVVVRNTLAAAGIPSLLLAEETGFTASTDASRAEGLPGIDVRHIGHTIVVEPQHSPSGDLANWRPA